MVQVLRFVAALLAWVRSSKVQREAEILYLRQQLIVLKRKAPARPKLKTLDRLVFADCRLQAALRIGYHPPWPTPIGLDQQHPASQ
jgi:hypothetical protein